jgi:rRNA maturation protein Nop10
LSNHSLRLSVADAYCMCDAARTTTHPPQKILKVPGNGLNKEFTMAKCEACGNDYDKSFEVLLQGKTHTFDSFECAIHTLAPTCEHCGVRIIGHGLEKSGRMFCCDHCAEHEGVMELRDRA